MPGRAVITVSDRSSAGARPDRSGPLLAELLAGLGLQVGEPALVPDERRRIVEALRAALAGGVDLVVTTGGTGLSPRDVTPEATREVLEREVPGLAEAIRATNRDAVPTTVLSRGVAGTCGRDAGGQPARLDRRGARRRRGAGAGARPRAVPAARRGPRMSAPGWPAQLQRRARSVCGRCGCATGRLGRDAGPQRGLAVPWEATPPGIDLRHGWAQRQTLGIYTPMLRGLRRQARGRHALPFGITVAGGPPGRSP